MDVIKTDEAFGGYAMSYKVQIVEKICPIVRLKAIKFSIKNLFNDILNETKGFRYHIAVKAFLKNTSSMEKLNLSQFILIAQQKQ